MNLTKLMSSLGLIVHTSKSIFFPCQEVEFLGFIVNSRNMTLTLTLEKKQKIILLCDETLSSPQVNPSNNEHDKTPCKVSECFVSQ